jgi:hypothetical protein
VGRGRQTSPPVEIKGSTKRGRILHKLMEEVLTSETQDTAVDLEVSPCNLGKCRVILPNCRDSAVLSQQKALASQWVG